MHGHMTTGTLTFLKTFTKNYKETPFFFMNDGANTIIYYESEKENKKIFSSGRSYELIIALGELKQEGYVVMNHLPISDESMPVFESNMRANEKIVQTITDIESFRLLKPLKGNTYIVMTRWNSLKSYELWKETDLFKQLINKQAVRSPGYYTDESFITSGSMIDKDLL